MYTFDATFQRPSRIDINLVQPHILNNLTSSLQVGLLLEIIKRSYMGQCFLSPVELARTLDSNSETIRHKLQYFCQLGIISHSYKNVYSFPYFKSMIKDTKGYVKLYDFLFQSSFKVLPLKSQRAILYVLGQLSEKSVFDARNIIIDTNQWYSRNEDRTFPLTHRREVNEIMQDLASFFIMDTTFYSSKGSVAIQGLKECYQKELHSSARYEWLLHFLEEYHVYYIHPFHLKNLVSVMDSLSMKLDYSDVIEVFHNAFFLMRFDRQASAYLGSLSYYEENEMDLSTYSKPVLHFINHYLQHALLQFGHSIESALYQGDTLPSFQVEDWTIINKLKEAKKSISELWKNKANQLAAVIKDIYLPKAMNWITSKRFSSDAEIREFVPMITKNYKIFNLFLDAAEESSDPIDTGYTTILNQVRKQMTKVEFNFYNWVKQ